MSEVDKLELPVIFGVKAGMTRVFDEAGNHVPVTVVKIIPNIVSQVKTKEKDGYTAYQIAYGEKREKLLNSPTKGHLRKAGISEFCTHFSEVRIDGDVLTDALGKKISISQFPASTYVDVTGVSKGKGFQGVMKRFNFQGGPAAHGSHFHRRPGSIGNRATPARVFAEKKLPGHMGCEKVTMQNLVIYEVNQDKGYILVKGSVPGAKNSFIKISKAIKSNK